ncbi:MAG: magnesium transporter, partial [Pollutimonas bauzanensis]
MSDSPVKPEESQPITIPRRLDPEDAQQALQQLQSILKRQEVVEALAHRQYESDDRSNLLEGLLHRQHENEIKSIINDLHPSDIAFILESLPVHERQAVWQ